MRLFIVTVNKSEDGKVIVTGKTSIGDFKGIWKSKDVPLVNEDYDVELTLPLLSRDSVKIEEPHLSAQSMLDLNERLYLRGKCEIIDEDDIYIMRFDTNWIEMLEIERNEIKVNDIISLMVPIDQVEIYPVSW